jgi:protein gp37
VADRTEIAWCDSTFNPWIGCTKVGPGCDHCYAERDMDHRRHRVTWGAGKERSRTSADYWKQPLRWNRAEFVECADCDWRGELKGTESGCQACLSVCIGPARRRVFCASLADVFDNEVPPSWRAELFSLIRATPNLDWLLLTKRIGNAVQMIDKAGGWSGIDFTTGATRNPLPNVWLGATVVNQAEAVRDIPKLMETPAAVRWLSVEPMLGPIDFTEVPDPREHGRACRFVDWVVVGGESGPDARPMHPEWARRLRDQCLIVGIPFLFKQWGEWIGDAVSLDDSRMHHWPDGACSFRAGKKAAGRRLDGRLYDDFPRAA